MNRSLQSILLSKIGGNVGHDEFSCILEYIDNSLDANCNNIELHTIIEDKKYYMIFYDDGEGCENIKNMLNSETGKKNAIGSYNQGELDVIGYMAGSKGKHTYISNHNKILRTFKINLDKMMDKYLEEKNKNSNFINYKICKPSYPFNFLEKEDYDDCIHNIKKSLIKFPELFQKIKNNTGTIKKIEITQTVYKNINKIKFDKLSFLYTRNFNFYFNKDKYNITKDDLITHTLNYKPLIIKIKTNKDNTIFSIKDNLEHSKKIYYKCSTCWKQIYDEINEEEINETLCKFVINLISENNSKKQKEILNVGEADLRSFWINCNGKYYGLPSWAAKTHAYNPQNFKNIRVSLVIKPEYIRDIGMTNKFKCDLNSAPLYLRKIMEYIYNEYLNSYFRYKNTEIKDKYQKTGILDMPNYLNEKIKRDKEAKEEKAKKTAEAKKAKEEEAKKAKKAEIKPAKEEEIKPAEIKPAKEPKPAEIKPAKEPKPLIKSDQITNQYINYLDEIFQYLQNNENILIKKKLTEITNKVSSKIKHL